MLKEETEAKGQVISKISVSSNEVENGKLSVTLKNGSTNQIGIVSVLVANFKDGKFLGTECKKYSNIYGVGYERQGLL